MGSNKVGTVWRISATALALATCAMLLLFYNLTFWQHTLSAYPLNLANLLFLASVSILFISVCFSVICLLNNKYLLKPALYLILIVSALSAYAMDTYGYIISANTLQNLFETDRKEMFDLFSLKLVVYLVLMTLLPAILIYKINLRYPSYKKNVVYFFLATMLAATNVVAFSKYYSTFLRNHKELRYYFNPIRPLYVLSKYTLQHTAEVADETLQILDQNPTLAVNQHKPRLIVLVVGESDRAKNHSLNGYARNTNPLLSQRTDVLSFKQYTSCGTETSVSVPCMFSTFKREDFSYAKGRYTENVLDLLQKSNVQVLWRDNDSGCKNVCERVPTDDFNDAKIAPFCNSFECHDEILLHDLQKYIDANPDDKLIVLHKKGNHGPAYYKRYPEQFAVFAPICDSHELQNCTNQEIVNAYDNIVLYTDYFLDKLIAQLQANSKQYQTAMIYVSDHGESLGENGVYLHAMPYWLAPKEQTHVPFMFWASEDFVIDRKALTEKLDAPLSHDHLFHSLLGLFGVQSVVYDQDLDIFNS